MPLSILGIRCQINPFMTSKSFWGSTTTHYNHTTRLFLKQATFVSLQYLQTLIVGVVSIFKQKNDIYPIIASFSTSLLTRYHTRF